MPQEGYQGIAVVRSFEACMELAALLSPPLTLFKFPWTAHLLNLGAATEDDLVQPTSSAFPASSFTPESQIVVTEKIDGANLGVSRLLRTDTNPEPCTLSQLEDALPVQEARYLGGETSRSLDGNSGRGTLASPGGTYSSENGWCTCTVLSTRNFQIGSLLLISTTGQGRCSRRGTSSKLSWRGQGSIVIVPALMRIHGRPEEGAGPVMPSDEELKGMVWQPSRFYDRRVEGVYVKVEKDGIVVGRGKVCEG